MELAFNSPLVKELRERKKEHTKKTGNKLPVFLLINILLNKLFAP